MVIVSKKFGEYPFWEGIHKGREPFLKGRLSTVDLLALTS